MKKSKNIKYNNRVRFLAAQIALSIDKLHNSQLIYRDLKPENILMDHEGYLKLSNFGMAKHLKKDEKASTFCGSPEYLGIYYLKTCFILITTLYKYKNLFI